MLQSHPNPKDSISAFPGRTSHNCTLKESAAGIPKDADLSSLLELPQCCHTKRQNTPDQKEAVSSPGAAAARVRNGISEAASCCQDCLWIFHELLGKPQEYSREEIIGLQSVPTQSQALAASVVPEQGEQEFSFVTSSDWEHKFCLN